MSQTSAESPLHEPNKLHLGALIIFLVAFVLSVAAVLILCYWVLLAFRSVEESTDLPASGTGVPYVPPPAPRLQPSPGSQVNPAIDLTTMHAHEYREFQQRGWVDPLSMKVRIPQSIVNQIITMSGGNPASQPSEQFVNPPLTPGPESAPTEPPLPRRRLKTE